MYPPVNKVHAVKIIKKKKEKKVHAGSFRVSVIYRTLTWTTGSLTCVRDHSSVYFGLVAVTITRFVFCIFVFCTLCRPNGIFPMGNSGRFP